MLARQPDYWERQERQVITTQSSALAAEKSELQEAEKQGWLSQDDWRHFVAHIDAELGAVKKDR